MDDILLKHLAREISESGSDADGVIIRKGVVASIQPGTPPTVTVTIGGVSVPGVRFVKRYTPVVSDVVVMFKQGPDYLVFDAIATETPSNTQVGNLEVDGALNHDGTTVGFYGVNPIARQALPAQLDPFADSLTTCIQRVNGITHVYLADLGLMGP